MDQRVDKISSQTYRMDILARNMMYYGREAALPERVQLRAGPLSLTLENGDLRWICWGKAEAVRRVYMAVRDQNWGTAPNEISNLQIQTDTDSFHIAYDAFSKLNEVQYAWHAEINGASDGTIVFGMDGIAQSTFMTNRLGFCVLHPMLECAGAKCVIEHSDGTFEHGMFPIDITPHQPFMDIRAIQYDVSPGNRVEVRFAGEVFEMEDQRNWTDASYKTYCTPLSKPYPRQVDSGVRVKQTVTISVTSNSTAGLPVDSRAPTRDEIIRISIEPDKVTNLPRIGLGFCDTDQRLGSKEVMRLQALRLNHLRVDIDLHSDSYPMTLSRAIDDANAISASLEIALFLSDDGERELDVLIRDVLPRLQPRVYAWLVFHTQEKTTSSRWLKLARPLLHSYDPTALIGGGTNAYFTELNRNHPPIAGMDFVAYSINPQVHAFDNGSLVENLAAQAETVRSAKSFMGDLPVHITPVTLKPRFNPDAFDLHSAISVSELPADVDVRQMSLFGACWTLGSLKYLAESGAASTTYFSTVGWKGVLETADGTPLPNTFHSTKGGVFPLYHVFASVGTFAGGQVVCTRSTQPLVVDMLMLRLGDRMRLVVANFSSREQHVKIPALTSNMKIRVLDETTCVDASNDPITFSNRYTATVPVVGSDCELFLRPFGIAVVDW